MIRQTVEWNDLCTESQCTRCPGRRMQEWREQALALTAAVGFFVSGIAVILLDGNLLTAVTVGLAVGLGSMLPAGRVLDAAEKRRQPACFRM